MKSYIILLLTLGLFTAPFQLHASMERWEQLTNGDGVEFLAEVPSNIQGQYFLLQIAKNDSEWQDVGDKNIHFMTVGPKTTVEHLNKSTRSILKIAKGSDKKGNQVVILLLNDKTTLTINLWNPENNLVYIVGDSLDSSGSVNLMHMRCWIKK